MTRKSKTGETLVAMTLYVPTAVMEKLLAKATKVERSLSWVMVRELQKAAAKKVRNVTVTGIRATISKKP